MKRGLEEVDDFSAWYAEMTGPRRGELGYLLLCEWRAVYAVDARVPYDNVLVGHDVGDGGFGCFLEWRAGTAPRGFACVTTSEITFYYPRKPPIEYTGWRNQAYWAARPAPPALEVLPVELWLHWSRLLSPYYYVSMASAPLCRAWRALWAADARGWAPYNHIADPYTDTNRVQFQCIRFKAFLEHCTRGPFTWSDAHLLALYVVGGSNFPTLPAELKDCSRWVYYANCHGKSASFEVTCNKLVSAVCWTSGEFVKRWRAESAEEIFNNTLLK